MTKPVNNDAKVKPVTPQEPNKNIDLPTNVVNMSIYLNGATETKNGKNSSIVEFTDKNFDHNLNIGDTVEYNDNGTQKKSVIAETKNKDEAQTSAVDILLEDGSFIKASKQNMFKASSLLNLKENNLTKDGTTLIINTKLDPNEMFIATNKLIKDCDRILQKDKIKTGDFVEKIKKSPDEKLYVQKAPSSYLGNETRSQAIQERPILCLLNFAGVKKLIIKPAQEELTKPLTGEDLDNPKWNYGLCVGFYSRNDSK